VIGNCSPTSDRLEITVPYCLAPGGLDSNDRAHASTTRSSQRAALDVEDTVFAFEIEAKDAVFPPISIPVEIPKNDSWYRLPH
jgi:hypothetical protein